MLPFDNLSADADNQYFCLGLLDEITTALAKTGALRVVARTSSARFKRGDDIATIGRQLKADVVLEGSVQKTSDRVKVTAQLINTADSLHIWSESLLIFPHLRFDHALASRVGMQAGSGKATSRIRGIGSRWQNW